VNKREFERWKAETGYSDINDWNMQKIAGYLHYFIKNHETGLYALIKEKYPFEEYEVLVEGWTDYNGWSIISEP
jgi:hypothetical protein